MEERSIKTNPQRAIPRESDNPIVEEYKEDLMKKAGYGIATRSPDEDARISSLESSMASMQQKLEDLERRLGAIDKK
jgi:hypothetical protein